MRPVWSKVLKEVRLEFKESERSENDASREQVKRMVDKGVASSCSENSESNPA